MLLDLLRSLLKRGDDPGRPVASPALAPAKAPELSTRILRDVPGTRRIIVQSDYGPLVVNRHDNMIGRCVIETGSWESAEIEQLRFIMQWRDGADADVEILDVGANVGIHTLAFACFPGRRVTVHAFEAQQEMLSMLRETIALNGLANVHCHHRAVSDRSGEMLSFPAVDYDYASNFGALELEPATVMDFDGRRVPGAVETVETLRIDDLGLTKARLFKVDVEGMENKVLAGARETIARCRPVMFIEYLKADFAELKSFLDGAGYIAYDAQRPNLLAVPVEMDEIRFEGARRL